MRARKRAAAKRGRPRNAGLGFGGGRHRTVHGARCTVHGAWCMVQRPRWACARDCTVHAARRPVQRPRRACARDCTVHGAKSSTGLRSPSAARCTVQSPQPPAATSSAARGVPYLPGARCTAHGATPSTGLRSHSAARCTLHGARCNALDGPALATARCMVQSPQPPAATSSAARGVPCPPGRTGAVAHYRRSTTRCNAHCVRLTAVGDAFDWPRLPVCTSAPFNLRFFHAGSGCRPRRDAASQSVGHDGAGRTRRLCATRCRKREAWSVRANSKAWTVDPLPGADDMSTPWRSPMPFTKHFFLYRLS